MRELAGRAARNTGAAMLPILICLAPVWAPAARLHDRRAATPPQGALRVECGQVLRDGPLRLRLRSGCVRLLLGYAPRSSLAIAFRYLGPSPDTAPLASGELRRQIGLKLRAKDTCNVVYVMWHLSGPSSLHVSVKSNPGRRLHTDCRDGGYLQVASRQALPSVGIGERHTLRARLAGRRLAVHADGSLVWEGTLPDAAFAFDGPAGLRSDNGNFDVELVQPEG